MWGGGEQTRQLQHLPSKGQHRSLSQLLGVLRGRKGAFCSWEMNKDIREGVRKQELLCWLGSILLLEDPFLAHQFCSSCRFSCDRLGRQKTSPVHHIPKSQLGISEVWWKSNVRHNKNVSLSFGLDWFTFLVSVILHNLRVSIKLQKMILMKK